MVGIAGAILLLLADCNKPNPKLSAYASRAAELFHQKFNDPNALHDSDGSWDCHAEVIRTTNGSFGFGGYLHSAYVQNARTTLGQLKNARVKESKTSSVLGQIYVALTYDDQFERGPATGKFVFMVAPEDDKPDSATMTVYSTISPLLQGQPTP